MAKRPKNNPNDGRVPTTKDVKYAKRKLVLGEDGLLKVVYIDLQTGKEIPGDQIKDYDMVSARNRSDYVPPKKPKKDEETGDGKGTTSVTPPDPTGHSGPSNHIDWINAKDNDVLTGPKASASTATKNSNYTPSESTTNNPDSINYGTGTNGNLESPDTSTPSYGLSAMAGNVARNWSTADKEAAAKTLAGELNLKQTDIKTEEGQKEAQAILSSLENRALKNGTSIAEEATRHNEDGVYQYTAFSSKFKGITESNFSANPALYTGLVDTYVSNPTSRMPNVTSYYNPSIANPTWGSKMTDVVQYGPHKFGSLPEYNPGIPVQPVLKGTYDQGIHTTLTTGDNTYGFGGQLKNADINTQTSADLGFNKSIPKPSTGFYDTPISDNTFNQSKTNQGGYDLPNDYSFPNAYDVKTSGLYTPHNWGTWEAVDQLEGNDKYYEKASDGTTDVPIYEPGTLTQKTGPGNWAITEGEKIAGTPPSFSNPVDTTNAPNRDQSQLVGAIPQAFRNKEEAIKSFPGYNPFSTSLEMDNGSLMPSSPIDYTKMSVPTQGRFGDYFNSKNLGFFNPVLSNDVPLSTPEMSTENLTPTVPVTSFMNRPQVVANNTFNTQPVAGLPGTPFAGRPSVIAPNQSNNAGGIGNFGSNNPGGTNNFGRENAAGGMNTGTGFTPVGSKSTDIGNAAGSFSSDRGGNGSGASRGGFNSGPVSAPSNATSVNSNAPTSSNNSYSFSGGDKSAYEGRR